MIRPRGLKANTTSKIAGCSRRASNTGYENDVLARPPVVVRCQFPEDEFMRARGPDTQENSWSRSGSRTISGFQIAASMRVKIAVFAPIPSASETIATAESVGARRNCRTAYRRSAATWSSSRSPRASRHSSFRASMPPNSRRALSIRLFGRQPEALEVRRVAVDVKLKLIVQLTLETRAAESRDNPGPQP